MPVANLFARPLWCDVDPGTGMIDATQLEPLVTERTKAIIVYHWGGDVADLDPLKDIARRHGAALIDDASAAFGAEYHGRKLGSTGSDFTVYSFYAVHHLTTGGEGGALFCASEESQERARWLRRYGLHQPTFRLPDGDLNPDSDVPAAGYNFPMNDVAAAIGIEQLKHADYVVARCRANGRYYDHALQEIPGIELVKRTADSVSGHWAYTLLAERRVDLMRKLIEHGIGCQRLHLRNDRYACFRDARRELPGVAAFEARAFSIPCGWWVGAEDRERIVALIRSGW